MKQAKSNLSLDVAKEEIKEWQEIKTGAVFEIGRILTEVKATDVKHGEWTAWLDSVGYNPRTAQRYMQIYKRFGGIEEAQGLSIGKLTELLSIPVAVDKTTLNSLIKQASSMTVREIRSNVRQSYGTGRAEESAAKPDTDEKDARIRNLERQVRELAHERDEYKRKAEEAEARAKRAETQKYKYMFSGQYAGLDPYELLGVSEEATFKAIRKRYRELMHVLHPDKGGDAQLFDVIKKAYDSIKEEVSA